MPKRSTAASAAKHTGAQGRGGEGEDARTPGTGRSSHGLFNNAQTGVQSAPASGGGQSQLGGLQTLSLPARKHLGGPARADVSC